MWRLSVRLSASSPTALKSFARATVAITWHAVTVRLQLHSLYHRLRRLRLRRRPPPPRSCTAPGLCPRPQRRRGPTSEAITGTHWMDCLVGIGTKPRVCDESGVVSQNLTSYVCGTRQRTREGISPDSRSSLSPESLDETPPPGASCRLSRGLSCQNVGPETSQSMVPCGA